MDVPLTHQGPSGLDPVTVIVPPQSQPQSSVASKLDDCRSQLRKGPLDETYINRYLLAKTATLHSDFQASIPHEYTGTINLPSEADISTWPRDSHVLHYLALPKPSASSSTGLSSSDKHCSVRGLCLWYNASRLAHSSMLTSQIRLIKHIRQRRRLPPIPPIPRAFHPLFRVGCRP